MLRKMRRVVDLGISEVLTPRLVLPQNCVSTPLSQLTTVRSKDLSVLFLLVISNSSNVPGAAPMGFKILLRLILLILTLLRPCTPFRRGVLLSHTRIKKQLNVVPTSSDIDVDVLAKAVSSSVSAAKGGELAQGKLRSF